MKRLAVAATALAALAACEAPTSPNYFGVGNPIATSRAAGFFQQVGPDTAENVFIVPSQPPVIYFTLVQNQPPLGRIQAFAVATGQ